MKFIHKVKANLNDKFANIMMSIMSADLNASNIKISIPRKNKLIVKNMNGSYYKITCNPSIENIESITLEIGDKNGHEIYDINYLSEFQKIFTKTSVFGDNIIKRTQIYNNDILISEKYEEYIVDILLRKIESFRTETDMMFFKHVRFEETEKIDFRSSHTSLIPSYDDFSNIFLMEQTDMSRYNNIINNIEENLYSKRIDVIEYYNEYNMFINKSPNFMRIIK